MECLYLPQLDQNATELRFDGDQVRHLRVLRIRPGQHVYVSNGQGLRAIATVVALDRTSARVVVESVEKEPGELPHSLTVAFGLLSAHDRIEWLAEKCTELGVQRLVPLRTQYAQVSHLPRRERLVAKMIAALKQSQRSVLPCIDEPTTIEELLKRTDTIPIVCAPDGKAPSVPSDNCTIIVGPEGGFSNSERALLKERSVEHWSLGGLRLRSETAAIAAVSLVVASWRSYMSPRNERMRERTRGM